MVKNLISEDNLLCFIITVLCGLKIFIIDLVLK